MFKSESILNLAEALAKAQATIGHAHKDNKNPFFNSTYADLASVWDACRKPLSDNKLSITQLLENNGDKGVKCVTMLMHGSGEFIGSEFSMYPKDNSPQAAGSCATYLRRYTLQAIVGISPSDDDGNAASAMPVATPRPPAFASKPSPGFDPLNAAHLTGIKAELTKRSIDKDQQVHVINAMIGKPLSELDNTIKTLKGN